jgi:desulfoferrodoxin-like iron-binding protein
MSAPAIVRGVVYRCPVCGAELATLACADGDFDPWCCNRPMEPRSARLRFYHCPVCGAEVALVRDGGGTIEPVCCNRPMAVQAA